MKGPATVERNETVQQPETTTPGRSALTLALGSVLCLVLAGGFLWWREGGDVFANLVTTALAWCF